MSSASGASNAWILTYTGVKFDLLNPTPDQVVLEDIAVALSRQARFNGHTKRFYSVAEHSLIGANLLAQSDDEMALEFLLHDAHEAYIGDMARPLKSLCPDFQAIEQQIDYVIRQRFGLKLSCPPAVKTMDRILLATEWRELMPECDRPTDFDGVARISSLRHHYFGSDLIGDFTEKYHTLVESIAAKTVLMRID